MFLPKPSEDSSFELTPAGTFTAICYRFIDRGTQPHDFNGERKLQREVMLSWELCGELMEDGRPFSASKRYNWSMNEKANLRKDLEAWRGRAFTDADFSGPNAFNTKNLLGVPCTLSITHATGKTGAVYANVTGIGKAMKNVAIPALVNPTTYLALVKGEFDPVVFAGLSEKMRTVISGSPEYAHLTHMDKPIELGPKPVTDRQGEPSMAAIIDDDIPF